jgi:hypothetical protein
MNILFNHKWQRANSKERGAFALLTLVAVVALLALCTVLFTQPARADSQGYPTTYVAPTNMPAIVTTSANSNSLSSFVKVPQGRGLGAQWQFNVSSGVTSAVLQISPSVDGTNASSTVWSLVATANGTTTVTATTNWARGTLDGYAALVVVGMTNANAGTLTNKGVLFNCPNN